MNENEGLILPSLVPVESQGLILPPGERANIEAERKAAMLEAIEAEEAERRTDLEYDDEEPTLAERCRHSVCKSCGHCKLVFLPAKLCEPCLKKAAEAAGLPFPKPGNIGMNRADRRSYVRTERKKAAKLRIAEKERRDRG